MCLFHACAGYHLVCFKNALFNYLSRLPNTMSVYLYHILIYQYFIHVINRVINCVSFVWFNRIANIYMVFLRMLTDISDNHFIRWSLHATFLCFREKLWYSIKLNGLYGRSIHLIYNIWSQIILRHLKTDDLHESLLNVTRKPLQGCRCSVDCLRVKTGHLYMNLT